MVLENNHRVYIHMWDATATRNRKVEVLFENIGWALGAFTVKENIDIRESLRCATSIGCMCGVCGWECVLREKEKSVWKESRVLC